MNNKFIFVSGLFSLILTGTCFLNTPKKETIVQASDTWQETRKTNELAIKYGQTVSNDSSADYTVAENGKYAFGIRHGDLSKGIIEKFDKVTSTSNSAAFVTESDETNKEFANVLHWAMYSSNGDGYSFFFKALDNISFSSLAGDYGGYTNGAYVTYYFKDQGSNRFIPLSSKQLSSSDKSAPFDTVNLFAGDEIYWEFISYGTSTGSNRLNIQRNQSLDFYPSFVIASPSDDADYIYGQETTYDSYFSNALNNIKNGETPVASIGYLDISFQHGYPRSHQNMEQFNDSSIFVDSSRDLARFSINNIQINANDDAILMYTAKENIVIDLNWSTDDINGIASTINDCSIRFYVVSNSGDLYFLNERRIIAKNNGKSGEYDISATLRQDESLLVSIGANDDSLNIINFTPTVSASIKSFIVDNIVDFSSISELDQYKITRINGLHWYFSSASGAYNISTSTVLLEHFTYCVDVEVRYQNMIRLALDKSEVDTLITQYKTDLKNISDAAKFVKQYLYMREYDIYWDNTSGNDLCKTYYSPAKTAFNALNYSARKVFCEDVRFYAAYDRFTHWAEANNDYVDEDYLTKSKGSSFIRFYVENKNTSIFVIIITAFTLLSMFSFALYKAIKRRAK